MMLASWEAVALLGSIALALAMVHSVTGIPLLSVPGVILAALR